LIKESLLQELTGLFSSTLAASNFELVDLICRVDGQRLMLMVLADKPQGGISLGECTQVCRQLKILLEEKNLIEMDYILEVASPGLDRPLKNRKDFARFLNQEAVFFLSQAVNGKCQWQGIISQAQENAVFVRAGDAVLEIPLAKINKAKLVIK